MGIRLVGMGREIIEIKSICAITNADVECEDLLVVVVLVFLKGSGGIGGIGGFFWLLGSLGETSVFERGARGPPR